jgi:Predicted methylated DNA-protein cysteine methyltransferase
MTLSAKSKNIHYQHIYNVVKQIPCGFIATYGQVAKLAGFPGHARQVGYALGVLRNTEIPWHRVINAKGGISNRSNPDYERLQQILLEHEGIKFNADGGISLAKYRWKPNK